ncbi:MAG: PP2C family protein-serine/threonine phosphatase [Planctomycetota bacterium]
MTIANSRLLARRTGIALIIIGAISFVIVMFFLGGATSSLRVVLPGVAAALGLYLVQKSVPSRRRRETLRDNALALLTVFFTFGTTGPLLMFVFAPDNTGPAPAVISIFVSGSIATLWACAFIFRAFWLLPITVAYQVFAPEQIFIAADSLGLMQNFGDLSPRTRAGATAALAVLSLNAGYIIFVVYFRRVERASARAKAELATAAAIHDTLTRPVRTPPGLALPLAIHGESHASNDMGGDLVECLGGRDLSTVYAIVADVSGHGVRAGVVMGVVKGALRERLADDPSPAELFRAINTTLCELIDEDMFVTAACVRFRSDGAEIALAGHPPPFRAQPGATPEPACAEGGFPLGVVPEETYEDQPLALEPGQSIVMFTDGPIETRGEDGRLLGLDGLGSIVGRVCDAEREPERAVRAIMSEVERVGPADDDRTVLIMTRSGAAGPDA